MAQSVRFGRRLALPSTLQIRRELIASMSEDLRLADLEKEKVEAARVAKGYLLPVNPT